MNRGLSAFSWDVIVIGAGPAGSVTSRELARLGCRVLLLDQARFPRAKVCGCCLNGAAIATLSSLGLANVLSEATPLERVCFAAGSRTAKIDLPQGAALSRKVFDTLLVEEATRQGVEFRPETHAKLGALLPEGYEVHMHDSTAIAKIVIHASGLIGSDSAPEPGSRIGAGTVVPSPSCPDFYDPRTIYMATHKRGYLGLVRVEEGQLDLAAAFDADWIKQSGGLGAAAEAILKNVGWPVPIGLAQLSWKGTPALTRVPARIAGCRQFAVGDAAGYIEPFTGEGMAWALMSARELAPIAARAAKRWQESLINDWERAHRRLIGNRQQICRVVARVLRSPPFCRIAVRLLSVFPILLRPVVASLNRPARLSQATSA